MHYDMEPWKCKLSPSILNLMFIVLNKRNFSEKRNLFSSLNFSKINPVAQPKKKKNFKNNLDQILVIFILKIFHFQGTGKDFSRIISQNYENSFSSHHDVFLGAR